MTGAWLRQPPGDGTIRLFCIPHAGGGGAAFAPWREPLLPDVDVCPVVLPGREARIRETACTAVRQLLDPLCEALAPHLDRPFAVLGHSMGAVVAYELARRLVAGGHQPVCLFVSGRRAPDLPPRRRPLHPLPESEFLASVSQLNGTPAEVLRQPELLRLFLPSLRADFELNERYQPLPGPVLPCAVSALTGDRDPEVTVAEMAAWRATTAGAFRLRVFRGDHFYLWPAQDELLAAIRADLRQLAGVPSFEQRPAASRA